jgi:hypothetical protein
MFLGHLRLHLLLLSRNDELVRQRLISPDFQTQLEYLFQERSLNVSKNFLPFFEG